MLLMKDIIREGHESLYKKAEPVALPMSDEDKKTLNLMMDYVLNSIDDEIRDQYRLRPSVGIAAPQINVLKRMVAIHAEDEKGVTHHYKMVNPRIISHSEALTYLPSGEGCLSIDREVKGYVMRPQRITVDTFLLNEDGALEQKTLRLKGYLAIICQHEIDHLNGILFPDHINKDNPYFIPENAKPVTFGD